jgi:hypothetical protein
MVRSDAKITQFLSLMLDVNYKLNPGLNIDARFYFSSPRPAPPYPRCIVAFHPHAYIHYIILHYIHT